MTIFAAGFAIFLGTILCYGLFSAENSSIGFIAGLALLIVVAICWYKGFWTPRTETLKPRISPRVEAEWRDKRL